MVFQIASAALTLSNYNTNSTELFVSQDSYALSITELVFMCLIMYDILTTSNKVVTIYSIVVYIYNLVYSGFIINYHDNNLYVNKIIANMSIAVIVTNVLLMCGCFSVRIVIDDNL